MCFFGCEILLASRLKHARWHSLCIFRAALAHAGKSANPSKHRAQSVLCVRLIGVRDPSRHAVVPGFP